MKRRVLAWVTAAAMLFTLVPGNALTAYAQETEESLVMEAQEQEVPVLEDEQAAEPVSDEEGALVSEQPEEELAVLPVEDASEDILVSEDEEEDLEEGIVEEDTEDSDLLSDMNEDGILFAADDESEDLQSILDRAIPIRVGDTLDIDWNLGTGYYYSFTPEKDGKYAFYSEGKLDTQATLYEVSDSELQYITENDFHVHLGDDCDNFYVRSQMTAGTTYILWVECNEVYDEEHTSTVTLETSEDVIVTWHKNYNGSEEQYQENHGPGYTYYRAFITNKWDNDEDVNGLLPDGFFVGSPDGDLVTIEDIHAGYRVYESVDLYLHWTSAIPVTWDLQGGFYYDDDDIQITENVTSKAIPGQEFQTPGRPEYPGGTKEFAGWSMTPGGEVWIEEDDYSATAPDNVSELTLYAVWGGCKHTNLSHVEAKNATCTEDGNIEYYECLDCGKIFSDEAGAEEITGSVVISATGHNNMIHHPRVEATDSEDGNIEYYECPDCEKLFSDPDGTDELTSSDIIIPKVGGILDIYKNAVEVIPGREYTDINAMYKIRIDREGEFKFYVDTDIASLNIPTYTDLTDTFSGQAINYEAGEEYFFQYYSEGNGNIAADGYTYFNFEKNDEDYTTFSFRAYPEIRINAPDDAIHDGGATEDIYADKGSDRTFTVDASSPYGEIRYEWGIKDWSGATSEGEFKPLGDDTGTSTYTLKDIKYSYTELVCRMVVLSDDGTPMEETAKDYCFCIHVEGGDDPEDDVTEWGMYTGTVSTADTVAPGSEVTFTVDVHNTMDIASKPSVYVWYYQEKYNSETYPGVEFGTLTGEGYSTEDGTLSLEAYGNRTLTLTGTIPQTWNDQSQILLVFLDYENDKAGQIEYPVEAVPGEYTVTYKFVCESGEELPDSILALCPNPEIHYTGEWVEATYPARQKVDEGDSIWSFEGYDIEGFQMGTADVTVTGTWMYRPKTDSEIAADALVNLSDGSDSMDPNAIVDLLENANSSEILGRLEETLGEESGNDEDGLNDALAQTTAALDEQLVDDSDVPDGSKKIMVSSGSQTTGAYVGNTSAGQTEDGVSVAISGAAATVASVIRSQDVDKLAQNENRHYQAVVSVDVVEKQNDSLTLDISLDVKVAETDQVVENDIEPVSPVTVTITLPDEYVGYDLTVIHTTRSGVEEEVSYSFINGGKQIRFTVSSLSPFELQILECMHSNLTPVTGLIATCAMDGRLGHWVCGTCGKKFLDEDCEQEVTDAQLVIPKSSYHTWNSTVTVAATEDTTGIMTHTCAVCGQNWTEVIPKTPVNITISKKPSKFKAKAEKKGKVTLTWKKLGNKKKSEKKIYKKISKIEIQYSTDKTFETGVKKKILSKKKAKYSVKLSKNTKYYFRIRYCDGKGGYSNWVVKSVKTKKK